MERVRARILLLALFSWLVAKPVNLLAQSAVPRAGRGAVATSAAPAAQKSGDAASVPAVASPDDMAVADEDAGSSDSSDTASVAAGSDESPTGGDQPRAVGAGDLITMNFQNVDLPVLAKFISEITGRNFVLDENVRGKVSIISPTRVTPEQAYAIFQSVLQLKGFTTVQAGSITKIIPSRDVRQSAELTQSQQPGFTQGDQYVTRMVKLRNTEASSVMSVIQPMVSHDGLIAAFPQDNTLIITDDAYNVQRLLRIIGSLDVQGIQQNVAVIPLKLAFADDLAQQIEKIMSAREHTMHGSGQFIRPGMGVVAPSAEGAATNFSIVADERTNSLVVLASPLEMRQIKDLVRQLDIPNETSRIHVYHLKFAPAGEMVDVLNGLMTGSGGPSSLSPTTGRNSLGRGGVGGLFGGGSFGSGFGGGFGSGFGTGFSSFGGTNSSFGSTYGRSSMGGFGMGGGSRSANTSGATTASSGSSRNGEFENPVSVTADPATNSLVISAAPQDYEVLRKVVEQLDVPRVQVFVQAIIVEVNINHARDIGVTGFAPTLGHGNVLGASELNFGQLQNALGDPLGLTGLGIGLASGSKCSIPGSLASSASSLVASAAGTGSGSSSGTVTVPCDVALMTALQTDTHSNLLSAPTLLTADNEEAMIVVGQNLPFVGSSAANAGLPGQIFNSVDRQNVGISLDLIPQVSEGDYIKLDIYEEVSNVVRGSNNQSSNPLGPTTTIRSASTTVLVQNHRTAVIGGLISSDVENTREGVPFLSDIPVLGNLFSAHSRRAAKDNLIVFLTPHIVRTREDLQALALDERQKFVRSIGRREVNNMPVSQFQQLYQPTFNAPVSPRQDLIQSPQLPSGAPLTPPTGASNSSGSASSSAGKPQQLGPSSSNAP